MEKKRFIPEGWREVELETMLKALHIMANLF